MRNGFKNIRLLSHHLVQALIFAFIITLSLTRPASSISDNLSGNIHVSGVNATTNGEQNKSLNQRYTVSWNKRLLPYLNARAAFNFDHFGNDLGEGGNVWRQQRQPSGEIRWAHPDFSLVADYRWREARSINENTDLINKNLGLNFSTRRFKNVQMTLGFAFDDTYNRVNRADRDTREKRVSAGLNRNFGASSFSYRLIRRDNDIISSNLNATETAHSLRWSFGHLYFQNKLSLSASYFFDNRRETTTRFSAGSSERRIDAVAGLYNRDITPDLGTLDTLRGLTDGNIELAVSPPINIGNSESDQNIGVDLGFNRSINGLNIYVNGPSGGALSWAVYLSQDNTVWEILDTPAAVRYNAAFTRYEIRFDSLQTRYIKAVNSGFNEVLEVYVSEVEAVEVIAVDREDKRIQSVHQVTMNSGYQLLQNLRLGFDVNLRYEPRGDFSNSRDQVYVGLSGRHKVSEAFTQVVALQAGYEEFLGNVQKDKNYTASYTLTGDVLPTAGFTLTALTRKNNLDEIPFLETNNILVQTNVDLLPGLSFSNDFGYSRNNQFLAGKKFETWTYRTSTEAAVFRTLDISAGFLYQMTDEITLDNLRYRRQVSGSFDFRPTRAIILRGLLTASDDAGRDYLSQEISAGWTMSRKLSLSGLLNIIEGDSNVRTERGIVRLNFKLSPRTNLYIGYDRTAASSTFESLYESFNFGLRSGF